MNYKVGKVVGINTDQRAAVSMSAPGEDGSLFLGVLQLECDDAFTKGRQLLSELADEFFDSRESQLQKLAQAAGVVRSKLQDSQNVSFLLVGFSGRALYLIGQGEVLALLFRNGAQHLDLNPEQVISGFLQPGDKVLLSTKALSDYPLDLPLEEWEEETTQKLGESEDPAQAGLRLDVETQEPVDLMFEPSVNASPVSSVMPPAKLKLPDLSGVKRIFPKSGRGRLILALILILALGLGAGYQYKVKKDEEKNRQFAELYQSAKGDFDAAKGLASLDPPAAKDKLQKAKDSLNKALALKSADSGAADLKKQIENEEGSILQQFEVASLPVFLDLNLIKDGFSATVMSLSGGKLLLLDTNAKSLVSVDMAKKSNQVLAGKDQLGDGKYSSINGDATFVYSVDKGIVKVGLNDKKVTSVSKKDDDWGNIVDIAGFAGNVYALDSGNPSTSSGQIWKYLVTSSGFGDKKEYLSSGVKADFSNALRMQIESSIYVLKQGGEILRYTKGASDNFSIGGLDKGIKDPKSIFVSSDTDNFYVLDSGNSRLVVLTKLGAYKSQYQAKEFGEASDLVVDEKGKKVYLLLGSKIYSMDLK